MSPANILRNALCLLLACGTALPAAAGEKFLDSGAPRSDPGRYAVTVAVAPGDDPATIAARLAATYRTTIEPAGTGSSSTFIITATEASARLLSADPAVTRVEAAPASRPEVVATDDTTPSWTTGTYAYDGTGNIKSVGTQESYTYDAFGRLTRGKVDATNVRNYTYDDFGNQLSVQIGDSGTIVRFGVDRDTNRLSSTTDPDGNPAGGFATYDSDGTVLTTSVGDSFVWDAAGMVKESTVGGKKTVYLYSPSDERIASVAIVNNAPSASTWTIRNGAGATLTRFTRSAAGTWSWEEDYVYRDGQLLAARVNAPEKIRHLHPDHLGTPRLITGSGGVELSRHTYYPFGGEVPPSVSPTHPERLKYTGHEYDSENLYYMHARYYAQAWGRFLSADPVIDVKRARANPQGWNRYAYVENRPVRFTDSTGRRIDLDYYGFDTRPTYDAGLGSVIWSMSHGGQQCRLCAKLPKDPKGLDDRWKLDDRHKNPNGKLFRDPDGNVLEWHQGQPGKHKWRGRDHWHYRPGGEDGDEHLVEGDEIPDPSSSAFISTVQRYGPVVAITVGGLIIVATIVEDFYTLGGGIADDPATIGGGLLLIRAGMGQ